MRFLNLLFTVLFILFGAIVGYQFSYILSHLEPLSKLPADSHYLLINDIILTGTGALVGFLVAPYFFRSFLRYVEDLTQGIQKLSPQEVLFGAGGIIFGLAASSLVAFAIFGPFLSTFNFTNQVSGLVRPVFIVSFILFFTSIVVLISIRLPFHGKAFSGKASKPKIVDTSAIIDGRIADVFETGFAEGNIVIPKFVLEELQRIADSSDPLKRNRGRRGLDILNRMRQSKMFNVQFFEREIPGTEVDAKLVNLAREIHGCLLTTDYNLNKVAQFQGVSILNINELANAVKPVVLPGEQMSVQIIREGKEQNQGVAYLDDGTMVVVENGRKFVGGNLDVEVTSVLQTMAGKMIFAKIR